MSPLKIIIIGAGIAGPAAAIDLARNGHSVTIYERSNLSTETGYAFVITANSDRCLTYLGIDTIAGGAVALDEAHMMDAEGQVVYVRREKEDAQHAGSVGGASVFAYRPAVHKQLMKAAEEAGVKTKLGVKVTHVDTANTAIFLESGEQVSADLIIGADGIYSVVRPSVIETVEDFPLVSAGYNIFRLMVSKQRVQDDPMLAPLIKENVKMFSWAGEANRKRIIVYPVDFDRQLSVVCSHPEELSDKEHTEEDEAAAIAYNQKASVETVMSIYSTFEPRATRLLSHADPDGFRIWKMADMDELPHWSRNRTTLVGDACHPVLPTGFSGASMGIEDAVTLSTLLPQSTRREDIAGRLRLYEELRKPRVARVRDTSRATAKGMDNRQNQAEYRQFLIAHDAVSHAKEALEKLCSSTA